MAFNYNVENFQPNEILAAEKLNSLVSALNELKDHLKIYDEIFSGNLNVTGLLTRNGKRVYDTENKPTANDVGAIPVTGSSSVSGSISPSNSLSDLGTTSARWRNIYGSRVEGTSVYDAGNRVYSPNNKPTASTVGAIPISGSSSITGSLTPSSSGSYNLGSSSYKWGTIYANEILKSGKSVLAVDSYSSSNNYIKFTNGFTICWGYFDVNAGTEIRYGKSFSSGAYVVACESNQNSKTYNMNVTSVGKSSFKIRKGNGGDHCWGYYIAVGF